MEASKFRLYNRAGISSFENYNSNAIGRTSFRSKKLVVIAHGYTGKPTHFLLDIYTVSRVTDMRNSYIIHMKYIMSKRIYS